MKTAGPRQPRFECKFLPEPMSGCWLWEAGYYPDGYGAFCWSTRNMMKAHKASWLLYRGETNGLHVLHRCDNPACVNPVHLFLGTNAQNVADRVAKGRERHLVGGSHPNAKLTDQQARDIRQDARPNRVIAEQYGVSVLAIQRIKRGATYPESH